MANSTPPTRTTTADMTRWPDNDPLRRLADRQPQPELLMAPR